jgi:hypothetical protein
MKRDLHSLRGLAWQLGIPLTDLRDLVGDLEAHYKPFESKRAGKTPRPIDQPVGRLKDTQRRIRARYLAKQPLDDGVRACVKGGSPYKNAKVHTNQKDFARVDVKNCYPSMTNAMTYQTFRSVGLGPKPASLLTRLTTRLGHLPQGAPTSDMIANLILRPVDQRVKEIAERFGLQRGRCMDDIAVSGANGTREAIGLIIAAIQEVGLAVRHRKTKHSGPNEPHKVTGFTVNGPYGPKVIHSKVQEIRTLILETIRAHERGESIEQQMSSVRGSLGYLRPTNPGVVRRLERQLAGAGISVQGKRRTTRTLEA